MYYITIGSKTYEVEAEYIVDALATLQRELGTFELGPKGTLRITIRDHKPKRTATRPKKVNVEELPEDIREWIQDPSYEAMIEFDTNMSELWKAGHLPTHVNVSQDVWDLLHHKELECRWDGYVWTLPFGEKITVGVMPEEKTFVQTVKDLFK